jgi:hypothetical protein
MPGTLPHTADTPISSPSQPIGNGRRSPRCPAAYGPADAREHNGRRTVHMDQNSTRADYMFRFLNKVFVGASDTVHVSESVTIEVIRGPGPEVG